MLGYIVSAVTAYLLGSLSFGIIFSKLKYKKDIRDYGSNNAGMTNMLRTFGKGAAALVFLFDTLKGAAAVLIAKYLLHFDGDPTVCAYTAMVFVVLGHLFPLYFGFRGGKGVLVGAVMLLLFDWRIFLIAFVLFFAAVFVTRWISLGSILGAISFPITTFLFYHDPVLTAMAFGMAVAVVFMHRSNIARILHGEENKFSFKSKKTIEQSSSDGEEHAE